MFSQSPLPFFGGVPALKFSDIDRDRDITFNLSQKSASIIQLSPPNLLLIYVMLCHVVSVSHQYGMTFLYCDRVWKWKCKNAKPTLE